MYFSCPFLSVLHHVARKPKANSRFMQMNSKVFSSYSVTLMRRKAMVGKSVSGNIQVQATFLPQHIKMNRHQCDILWNKVGMM